MGERALRWVVWGAVGAAVLPVVVAAGRAIAEGWVPVWDDAYPAIRAWDVFSKNPPLVGTRSTAADMSGTEHVTHHPGPMEFYLLAPWLRLFGPAVGTIVGVALVNVGAIVTIAWLSFRRGKHLATVVAMAATAALTWSMGSEMLFDPWPPHVTLLPFAAVLAAAWSVADRDLAALPVLAVAGSFVLQTHTGYVVLVPGVVATAVGLLAWRSAAERRGGKGMAAEAATADTTAGLGARELAAAGALRSGGASTAAGSGDGVPAEATSGAGVCDAPAASEPALLEVAAVDHVPDEPATSARPTGVRRWGIIAAAVGLVCWAPPLYEQLAHEGGNFTFLLEAGVEGYAGQTYSVGTAVRLVAGTLSLPPWWLPPSMESPAISLSGAGPSLALSIFLLGLLLAALAVGARRALRRGNPTLASGAVVAVVATGLTIYSVANSPVPFFALKATGYVKFIWITAAFVATVLALVVLDEVDHHGERRSRAEDRKAPNPARAVVGFAAVALVAGLLALPKADRAHTGSIRASEGVRELADAVLPAVEGRGTVLVDQGASLAGGYWYGPGLMAELVAEGVPVVVRDPELVAQLGRHRAYERGEADVRVHVVPGTAPPMFAQDAELIASVGGRTAAEQAELDDLRRELRVAIDRAGGLPLVPLDEMGSLRDQIPAVAERVDLEQVWSDVEASRHDPDAILGPGTAAQLFDLLDLLDVADEALADEFPTGDLVRYYTLQGLPDDADVSAWLEEL